METAQDKDSPSSLPTQEQIDEESRRIRRLRILVQPHAGNDRRTATFAEEAAGMIAATRRVGAGNVSRQGARLRSDLPPPIPARDARGLSFAVKSCTPLSVAEARAQPHPQPDTRPCPHGADQRPVFAIAAILRPGEGYVCSAVGDSHVCRPDEKREKQRNARGILVEDAPKRARRSLLLVAHHRVIENREIYEHQSCPPTRNVPQWQTRGEKRAAEIKRIARARVGTGGGEFPSLRRCPEARAANQQSERGDGRPDQDPVLRRAWRAAR